jgi:hypothetical protein
MRKSFITYKYLLPYKFFLQCGEENCWCSTVSSHFVWAHRISQLHLPWIRIGREGVRDGGRERGIKKRGGGREGLLVQHCLILFGLCVGIELSREAREG